MLPAGPGHPPCAESKSARSRRSEWVASRCRCCSPSTAQHCPFPAGVLRAPVQTPLARAPLCSNLFTIQSLRPANLSGSDHVNCPTNVTFDKNVGAGRRGWEQACWPAWQGSATSRLHAAAGWDKGSAAGARCRRLPDSAAPTRCLRYCDACAAAPALAAGPVAAAAGAHVLRVAQLPG